MSNFNISPYKSEQIHTISLFNLLRLFNPLDLLEIIITNFITKTITYINTPIITMGKVAVIGGITCLFTLTALALVAYNTEPHCSVKTGDDKVTGCTDSWKKNCDAAYAVSVTTEVLGIEITTKYSCPWNTETVTLGLTGLGLTVICLGFLFFTLRGKDLKTVVLTMIGVIVPILLSTFGLMIRDLKRGYDYKKEAGLEEGFRPGTYIANIILLFFGVCLLSTAAFLIQRQSTQTKN